MRWEERAKTKKGNLGEAIIKEILEERGYVVYKCITFGSHAFDFLAVRNKREFKIIEVKSKARLNKYYATGIDEKYFYEYKAIFENQKIDVIIFFVDDHPNEERIYCQNLSKLMEDKIIDNIIYPNSQIIKGSVVFSLTDMIHVRKLSPKQVHELREYSKGMRHYPY